MESETIDQRPSKRARLSPSLEQNGSSSQTVGTSTTSRPMPGPTPRDAIDLDLREIEVGISAYASEDIAPFKAFLKTRYTDFLVNEILPGGEVVHLTSTKVPEAISSAKPKPQEMQASEGGNDIAASIAEKNDDVMEVDKKEEESADFQSSTTVEGQEQVRISEEAKQKLVSYLNEKAVSELLSLYQTIIKNPYRKAKDHSKVRTEFTSDRTLRSEIHKCIRETFESKIDSSTDKDGVLILSAANPNSRYNRPQKNKASNPIRPDKLGWAERGGEYLHFTLYKENKDTMEAISWLVRQMKINAKVFQFAGTKDRRAATAQRVSAHRIDADRLAGQNRSLRNSAVGDFKYQPHGLDLGDLAGNEFTITLRDCEFPGTEAVLIEEKVQIVRERLQTALDSLHTKGYLNYYGLQRFGTFTTRTDATGLLILKGDFKEACESILEYDTSILPTTEDDNDSKDQSSNNFRSNMSDDLQRAQAMHNYKKDNNLHKCLELLPRKFSAETTLLRHLHRQSQDYFGALMSIHRNLRLMYIHAYQSLVWNHALTNRMTLYGHRVVEGDLILISEHSLAQPTNGQQSNTTAADQETIDADGEIIITPSAHDKSSSADDMFERARPLTLSEAESGAFSIFDIVLPLPGFDIEYPSNPSGDFYTTFMKTHGGLDPKDMRRKQRDFSLSGSYRKIMSRVLERNRKVEVHRYTRDEEQFVKTDMEILKEKDGNADQGTENGNGRTILSQSEAWKAEKEKMKLDSQEDKDGNATNATTVPAQKEEVESSGDGKEKKEEREKIAAVLRFQLGSSQYATMALRELSRGGIVAYKPDFSGGRG